MVVGGNGDTAPCRCIRDRTSRAPQLPTRLVELTRDGMTADQIEQHLRALDPPVIARIQNDRVVLDLRTVLPEEAQTLTSLLAAQSD